MPKPLEGIRIIDFTRFIAGPMATVLLSDLGAEVIRVESPGGNKDRDPYPLLADDKNGFMMLCSRGKKFITLSMRSPRTQEIVDKLVSHADIISHNYVPGTTEAKILDYERLRGVNPHIIESAVSTFGQDGPYASRPGVDTVAQAMCGSMSYTGFPENPPTRSQVAWVDGSTAMLHAFSLMVALYNRDKTGHGEYIDVSLLDTAVFMSAGLGVASDYQLHGVIRDQLGNQSWYAPSNCYKASDGWLMITLMPEFFWKKICQVLGKQEWADDLRFKDGYSMFQHRDILNPVISEWVSKYTVKEVEHILAENHIPCGPVYNIDQVIKDEQVRFREMLIDVICPGGGTTLTGNFPVKFRNMSASVGNTISESGFHNKDVYCGLLEYDNDELKQLEREKVI